MVPKNRRVQARHRGLLGWLLYVAIAYVVFFGLGGYPLRPDKIPCEVLRRLDGGRVVEPCNAPGFCEGIPAPTAYGRWCRGEEDLSLAPVSAESAEGCCRNPPLPPLSK
jgi:hypothetical protein